MVVLVVMMLMEVAVVMVRVIFVDVNVYNFQVKRFAFKDLHVTHRFYLGEVNMNTIVSMAFTFDYVKVRNGLVQGGGFP